MVSWIHETCLSPPVIFLLTFQRGASFVDPFSVICVLSVSMPYCLVCVLQPCGHLLGKD